MYSLCATYAYASLYTLCAHPYTHNNPHTLKIHPTYTPIYNLSKCTLYTQIYILSVYTLYVHTNLYTRYMHPIYAPYDESALRAETKELLDMKTATQV
jgi:hypothetical protein